MKKRLCKYGKVYRIEIGSRFPKPEFGKQGEGTGVWEKRKSRGVWERVKKRLCKYGSTEGK